MSVLEMRRVSRTYGLGAAEVHALSDIDLSVDAGTMVAVMGPSGSGKSTLLTIAGSLEEQSTGEVRVCGQELSTLSRNAKARLRRRSIGYVFQDFNLLAGLTALSSGKMSAAELALTAGRLALFLVAVVALGMLLVPRFVRSTLKLERPETTVVVCVGICFAVALLAQRFGYSVALGAFLAGSLVAESGQGERIEHLLQPSRVDLRDLRQQLADLDQLVEPGPPALRVAAQQVAVGGELQRGREELARDRRPDRQQLVRQKPAGQPAAHTEAEGCTEPAAAIERRLRHDAADRQVLCGRDDELVLRTRDDYYKMQGWLSQRVRVPAAACSAHTRAGLVAIGTKLAFCPNRGSGAMRPLAASFMQSP